jgi:hypothetical protein
VELDAHSAVHLMATAVKAEVGGNPHRSLAFAKAQATSSMLSDWARLMPRYDYIGHYFTRLREGVCEIRPSHVKGGPWLRPVFNHNRLTARLVRALTGHAPIGSYRTRFFREPSHCMCGHPFEDVPHIIHFCPMWSRAKSPGKRYRLAVFVKFLKDNPRAFAFPGENLDHEEERRYVGEEKGSGAPSPSRNSPLSSPGSAQPRKAPSPPGVTRSRPSVNIRLTDAGTAATVLQYSRTTNPRSGAGRSSNQTDIRNFFVRR